MNFDSVVFRSQADTVYDKVTTETSLKPPFPHLLAGMRTHCWWMRRRHEGPGLGPPAPTMENKPVWISQSLLLCLIQVLAKHFLHRCRRFLEQKPLCTKWHPRCFQKPSILLLSKLSCWAHLAKNIQNQVRRPMQHRLSGSKRWAHPRSFHVSTHAWTPARVARILARVDDSIQALQAALKRSWDWGNSLFRIHSEMKASRALASEDAGVEGGDASPGASGPTAGATSAGSATGVAAGATARATAGATRGTPFDTHFSCQARLDLRCFSREISSCVMGIGSSGGTPSAPLSSVAISAGVSKGTSAASSSMWIWSVPLPTEVAGISWSRSNVVLPTEPSGISWLPTELIAISQATGEPVETSAGISPPWATEPSEPARKSCGMEPTRAALPSPVVPLGSGGPKTKMPSSRESSCWSWDSSSFAGKSRIGWPKSSWPEAPCFQAGEASRDFGRSELATPATESKVFRRRRAVLRFGLNGLKYV